MKRVLIAGVFLVANVAGPVLGACTAVGSYHRLGTIAIANLLGNAMACYPAAAPFTNQEYHTGSASVSSGSIVDYKKGPTDHNDPSATVGTYTINTLNATVTYTYTGNPSVSYTYTVWGPIGTNEYDFCVGLTPLSGGPVRIVPTAGAPIPC